MLAFFREYEFDVEKDDFAALEIRDTGKPGGLHYFYDVNSRRLITDFLIWKGARVSTVINITLIKKSGRFEPRLKFWKRNNSAYRKVTDEPIPGSDVARDIKASVDTSEGHENFWKVINFLQSFSDIDAPSGEFRVVDDEEANLVQELRGRDKNLVLSAVRSALGGQLTDEDLEMLADRKSQLEAFRRLLEDDAYFSDWKDSGGFRGDEAVWQDFFERNQWIFGYGLALVACDSFDGKLERFTTGANIFGGAGKRSDAVMKTRGLIKSLLFAEIKTHKTSLLDPAAYRPPDVYKVSDELSGGLSQVQKTVDKAVRAFHGLIEQHTRPDGTPTGVEFATVRPRQILVIGHMNELKTDGAVNAQRVYSFELFRRSIQDVEVVTFDELYERASFIVRP